MPNTPSTDASLARAGALVLAGLLATSAGYVLPALACGSRTEAVQAEHPVREPLRSEGALHVRLRDPNGAPWDRAIDFQKSEWAAPRTGTAWPRVPRLVVERAPRERHVGDWPGCTGFQTGPGEFTFESLAPGAYVVGVLGGDVAWAPRAVEVAGSGLAVEVELACLAAGERGTLVLDAVACSGGNKGELVLRIEDPRTGLELIAPDPDDGDVSWPQRVALPAGAYRAVVEGAPGFDGWHGTRIRERTLGRVEQEFVLEPGRETRTAVTVPAGARLLLTVHASANELDRAAVRREFSAHPFLNAEQQAELATVELRRPGRAPLPVDFPWVLVGTSAAGTHLRSAVELRETRRSEVVPTGAFTLVARLAGGRSAERAIELVEGATLVVDLAPE